MANAQTVRDVMTPNPRTFELDATVTQAAQAMRDDAIGDVIVCSDGEVRGIVTDRDITVRVTAEGRSPDSVRLGEVCTSQVAVLHPDDPVDLAVRTMREHAIRRLPVVDGSRPVGIVSIGDLAIDRDADSALAAISAAPANS